MAKRSGFGEAGGVTLSARERVLLLMIHENTDVDWDVERDVDGGGGDGSGGEGEIYQYFHGDSSQNTDFFVGFQTQPVFLWELGDRACLARLEDQGLIRAPFPGEDWNFVTTQAGDVMAEVILTNKKRGRPRKPASGAGDVREGS